MESTDREILEHLAWAAGFIEGDGCFSRAGNYPMISAGQVEREPLDRLRSALRGGNVRGPYNRSDPSRFSKREQYTFQMYADADRAALELWPYLGNVKREQCLRVCDIETPDQTEPPIDPQERRSLAWAARG